MMRIFRKPRGVPAPGSPEAAGQRCTCPVIDNHHGRGRPDGTYVINLTCPVHGGDKLRP